MSYNVSQLTISQTSHHSGKLTNIQKFCSHFRLHFNTPYFFGCAFAFSHSSFPVNIRQLKPFPFPDPSVQNTWVLQFVLIYDDLHTSSIDPTSPLPEIRKGTGGIRATRTSRLPTPHKDVFFRNLNLNLWLKAGVYLSLPTLLETMIARSRLPCVTTDAVRISMCLSYSLRFLEEDC